MIFLINICMYSDYRFSFSLTLIYDSVSVALKKWQLEKRTLNLTGHILLYFSIKNMHHWSSNTTFNTIYQQVLELLSFWKYLVLMIKNCAGFVLLKNRSPNFLQTCLAKKMAIDFRSRDWMVLGGAIYRQCKKKWDHC